MQVSDHTLLGILCWHDIHMPREGGDGGERGKTEGRGGRRRGEGEDGGEKMKTEGRR